MSLVTVEMLNEERWGDLGLKIVFLRHTAPKCTPEKNREVKKI
jgi:hypothetical protein